MFTLEKDMIPILRDKLATRFATNLFIEEFRSGNGVVDLIFSTNYTEFNERLGGIDFQTVYFLTNFLNKKNKRLPHKAIISDSSLVRKKVDSLLEYLMQFGYLEKKGNNYIVKRKYNAALKDLISVEAKIKDWKKGFHQAMRYKYFSNMSFLAISIQYLHRVDMKLLKRNNVGLIAVSKDDIQLIFNPQKKTPPNKIAYNYLCEYFTSILLCSPLS